MIRKYNESLLQTVEHLNKLQTRMLWSLFSKTSCLVNLQSQSVILYSLARPRQTRDAASIFLHWKLIHF